MAIARVVRRTCDRCNRMIAEEETDQDPKLNVPQMALLYAEAKGLGFEEPVKLLDLCDKCKKRVTELVSQLVLSGKGADEDDKGSPEAETETAELAVGPEEPTKDEEPRSRRRRREASAGEVA
jgi:hypothetical protein